MSTHKTNCDLFKIKTISMLTSEMKLGVNSKMKTGKHINILNKQQVKKEATGSFGKHLSVNENTMSPN